MSKEVGRVWRDQFGCGSQTSFFMVIFGKTKNSLMKNTRTSVLPGHDKVPKLNSKKKATSAWDLRREKVEETCAVSCHIRPPCMRCCSFLTAQRLKSRNDDLACCVENLPPSQPKYALFPLPADDWLNFSCYETTKKIIFLRAGYIV